MIHGNAQYLKGGEKISKVWKIKPRVFLEKMKI